MSTALAPAPPAVLEQSAPMTGAQLIAAFKAYRDIQTALDGVMADQIIQLEGKAFRKKGYWRGLTVGYGLTVECVEERRELFGTLPNGGDNFAWVVMYRASTKSGRSGTGDGACSAAEKSVGRMRATEHLVRSHAHTRAFNRAVSNLVGFGEVSAEELEPETPPARAVRAVPAADGPPAGADAPVLDSELPPAKGAGAGPVSSDHVVYVTAINRTPTRNPKVTKYTLTIAGGPDWPANQNTVSTITRKWADLAADAMKANRPVRLRTKKTEYGYDIAALEALDDQGQPLPLTSDDIPFR